jgi:PiT family inorganic phosphate transporter
MQGVIWPVIFKILLFLVMVPLAGSFLSFVLARSSYMLGASLTPAAGFVFRILQIFALAGVALAHGSNDGQKSMAMMLLALLAVGTGAHMSLGLPWVLRALCGMALAIGVIFGSRGVIGTLGRRLYRVQPLQGFCAETSSIFGIGFSSLLGYPVSTTHMMSMSILGAGVAVHPGRVRWGLVGEIGMAWLLTIPASAAMAALTMLLLRWGLS